MAVSGDSFPARAFKSSPLGDQWAQPLLLGEAPSRYRRLDPPIEKFNMDPKGMESPVTRRKADDSYRGSPRRECD